MKPQPTHSTSSVSIRVHPWPFSVVAGALILALLPLSAAGDDEAPWGEKTENLQARVSAIGSPAIDAPIKIRAELKNLAASDLPKKNIRIWLLVAQGADHIYYTAPHAVAPRIIAANDTLDLQFDAGPLDAFRYAPDIEIRDGIPSPQLPADAPAKPAASQPAAKPLGKLKNLLAVGPARVKAFVVLTQDIGDDMEKKKAIVIPTPTITITLAEAPAVEFNKLDAAGKQAFFDQITAGFQGDAVAAKNAHDRAVKIGEPAVLPMIALIDNKSLSAAGQMWLADTLVDLNDPRTIDPLIKIVEKGGPGARVAAYHGPKLHYEKLTAAITKTATTTKDQELMAWAARGLGTNGDPVDPNLFDALVTKSDPLGRGEATTILASSTDPKSAPLLAKLVNDPEPAVRYRAIAEITMHHRTEPDIMAALEKATTHEDPQTAKIAKQCIAKLGRSSK